MKVKMLLFPIMLLLIACQKESVITLADGTEDLQRTYNAVDKALWIHFQSFENEGAKRGLNIDLASAEISGVIEKINEDQVVGQCNYYSHRPNHVTIDQTFWNQASAIYREYVVFHELGHCYLGRPHNETALSNGVCTSIMNSGTGNCVSRYSVSSRSNYLDELFDRSVR